jgi:hypothetical protein
MRVIFTIFATLLTTANPVAADPCTDEIAAMFLKGSLNAFSRPSNRASRETFAPDGTSQDIFDVIVETPLLMASGVRGSGQFYLSNGNDTYSGPSLEGPWTSIGQMQMADLEAAQRSIAESQAKNVTEAECLGTVELDGQKLINYRFRNLVGPDPIRAESWWGSLDSVFIDPETNLVMRWEMTENIASWAPEVNHDRHVTTYSYEAMAPLVIPE